MDAARDSLVAACVLAVVVLAFPLNTRAGNQEHAKPSAVARGERWRVEVSDPVANRVTRDALDGA
jgi:DMSO/TMAO reductase YedYZ molybdopterin-dependent catalytic subunit